MTEPTRAIMVGCGGISQAWLSNIVEMDNVQMVGMVDLMPEVAKTRAEQFGIPDALIGSDMDQVIRATQPDVLFNCTIPAAHVDVTIRALEQGLHVLGEKPLADSMENAHKMIAAADKAGKIFAVIQNRRYKHVLLLDMAIHTFDQARYLTGADPVSVYCKEWNPSGSWYDQDASAICIYEMSGGIVYTYRGSWCAEGMNTSWECEWRMIGEQGSLLWNGEERIEGQKVAKTGAFFSEHDPIVVPDDFDAGTKVGAHGGVIREFIDCVRNGGTPETIATDNIKSLAMVFGAIESAETGRRVDIQV